MAIEWSRIERRLGDKWTLKVSVVDDAGADLDVSGLTGTEAQVRAFAGRDSTPIFSKSITEGSVSVATNVISCAIEPDDLPEGTYRLEVWIVTASAQDPVAYGEVHVGWMGGPA